MTDKANKATDNRAELDGMKQLHKPQAADKRQQKADIDNRDESVKYLARYLCLDPHISAQAVTALLTEFTDEQFDFFDNEDGTAYSSNHDIKALVDYEMRQGDLWRDCDAGPRNAVYFHYNPGNERQAFSNMLKAAKLKVAYNTFTETPEIKRGGGDWRRVHKGEIQSLRTELPGLTHAKPLLSMTPDRKPEISYPVQLGRKKKIDHGWKLTDADWSSHMSGITWAERRNPIALRLAEIESKYKDANLDGKLLMDAWQGWFDCEGKYREAMDFMLPILICGLVNRGFEPGAKHDLVPALIGDPGIGKSSLLKCIPWDPDTQFRDDYRFPKGGAEATQAHGQQYIGILVIELAEMEAFRRADQEAVQAAFTRQSVNFRRAWGRESNDPYQLQCVKAITSNLDDVIVKPAGVENRRVLPMKSQAKFSGKQNSDAIRESWTPEFRELIFAHGIHLKRSGKWDAMIEPVEACMKRLTPDHVRVDEVAEDYLTDALQSFTLEEQRRGLTRKEIMAQIPNAPVSIEKRFVPAIRGLGFEGPFVTTRDGVKRRLWQLKQRQATLSYDKLRQATA